MIFNQQLKQWKQYFDVYVFFLGTICHFKKKTETIWTEHLRATATAY